MTGQAEVVALLRRLAGREPLETHISLVFVGTDAVWKLKKAVRLSYLDFSSVAARQHFALRELALNAPAAPGLYRDVVPVLRRADGSLALGEGDGAPVDWVLRMARVPEGDFLDVIATEGRLTPSLLEAIADTVAAYHAALPAVSGNDPAAALRAVTEGNARSALEAGLPPAAVGAWDAAAGAALDGLAAWLGQRAAAGFVRRAHGDLHLGNLCLWQGKVVPFDALEFDEALATIDLGYDLAFLLMDLDQRVERAAANRVMNRYVARTGDSALVRGLPLFLSLRAMVRAHVAASASHAHAGHAAGLGKSDAAGGYLRAAMAYLQPAPTMVVAVGGLPGTGKSTLARALAPGLGAAPGALVLRSDEIRKRQHGVAPEHRLPEAAYGPGPGKAVFAALSSALQQAAADGHAVVADATFMASAHRRIAERAAAQAGVPFVGLWLQAPLAVLEARLHGRTGDASDATIEVLHAASRNDPGPGGWLPIDAANAQQALDQARAAVRSRIPGPMC